MAALPYVTAPGNVEKALLAIKSAATPEKITQDFVKTILKIPGGSGSQITAYLKKIGFASADGSPSDIYKKFRNTGTAGKAIAKAIRIGYAPLYVRNEYMHELPDAKLKGLVIEETGQGEDANVVTMILSAIKTLKKYADFSEENAEPEIEKPPIERELMAANPQLSVSQQKLGFNLSYTINLNLPATSDIAVFNAIFKSLKENLLKGNEES